MGSLAMKVRGFTLIELMITIAILGILLAIAAPSFSRFIASQRIKSASFDLQSALMQARSEAIKRGPTATITVQAGSVNWANGWKVMNGGTTLAETSAIERVTITETGTTTNATVVTYSGDGRVQALGSASSPYAFSYRSCWNAFQQNSSGGRMLNSPFARQAGITMIEVLISIVVLSVGLLGLAGLMSVATKSELEGYQRIQALAYLSDITDRIATNRAVASCYISSNYGTAISLPVCGSGNPEQYNVANSDMSAWSSLLKGTNEKSGTTAAGGIVGARGCVERISGSTTDYRISVAWQGMDDISVPHASLTCGSGSYGTEGRRRVVSTILSIPIL
jgi:type IV pilus assembly protein PilV